MAAENSLSPYAREDSLEIATGLASLEPDSRVVVVIDDATSTRLCVGTAETPLQTVRTFSGNPVLTDSATMLAIMRDIVTTYPARSYGLVLWSHASGWVPAEKSYGPRRTFGKDSGRRAQASDTGQEMDVTTLAHVLAQTAHFDYVFFDACFMQSVEVAYELRHATDYVIASPAEIPGSGAPYDLLMPLLSRTPVDAAAIVDTYVDYYETGAGASNYYGAELVAVRTDRMETAAEVTRPLVQALMGGRRQPSCTWVQSFCPPMRWSTFTECYDIGSLMSDNLPEADYEAWRQVLSSAIVHARLSNAWTTAAAPYPLAIYDPDHTLGITMFVPSENYALRGWTDHYRSYAWATAVDFAATGW